MRRHTILAIATLVIASATCAAAFNQERAISLQGFYPTAALISDGHGDLYGTTNFGGSGQGSVNGTVFELSRNAKGVVTQKIIYNFTGGSDGGYPYSSLVFDKQGNLYGTASEGGDLNSCQSGCGVVFELSPQKDGAWTEKVLHTFNGNDGSDPLGPVSFDSNGNLFGTTQSDGYSGNNCWNGCGYVFEMTPQNGGSWSFQNIYAFQGNEDAGNPQSQLIFDKQGNIYGTAGWDVIFPEVVFELTPSGSNWNFHLLYSFDGCQSCDTFGVLSGVTFDTKGNLYGTIPVNGTFGAGTLYELSPQNGAWNLTILHEFTNGPDGGEPFAAPVFDSAGNMYGTTSGGGMVQNAGNCGNFGCGLVYKLTPNTNGGWTGSVLYDFLGGNDGGSPEAGLLLDSAGNLYGTTYYAGRSGDGVAFVVSH